MTTYPVPNVKDIIISVFQNIINDFIGLIGDYVVLQVALLGLFLLTVGIGILWRVLESQAKTAGFKNFKERTEYWDYRDKMNKRKKFRDLYRSEEG